MELLRNCIVAFIIGFFGFSYAVEPSLSKEEETLIQHVQKSIDQAENEVSKLPSSVLAMQGMSSPRVRHFLNNLCTLDSARYLEIGSWKGSTLIAAVYQNENHLQDVVAIDNWSEFGGPRQEFFYNINRFLPGVPLRILETNCFTVNKETVFHKPINLYFYDGNHSAESQKLAFTYFDSIFDDLFVAIVDDWNWPQVQEGTFAAFQQLNYQVLFEVELDSPRNSCIERWWNGLYVAVIRKPPKDALH